MEWPTDAIQLTLGDCKANLSAIRKHIEIRVRAMEEQLDKIFQMAEKEQVPVFNDVFMCRSVKRKQELDKV
jgi:exo-beta-1,3-glucanase (GH17 family)